MKQLLAEALATDPRIAQAKRSILKTLAKYQARLDGVRPAVPERRASYEELLENFGRMRGGNLFYPYLGSGFGKGPLVELADGSVKYDFISGIGVHYFGHGHPGLVEAMIDAALADTVMQGNLQQETHSVPVVEMLLDAAGAGGSRIEHCFLTTSGAMANENALKLMFQKRSPATRILAFEGCFMGRTLTLSQVTDKPAYRDGLPQTVAVDYVPYFDRDDPELSTDRALATLMWHLERYPGGYAGMCFELVLGEGGYYEGRTEFFTALMRELKEHGVPVMVDEVQTFGRTGSLFAFQHFGLEEYVDVVTIGKMSQVCATLFASEFKPRPGLISQTFTGSTSSIFAAGVMIREMLGGGYFGPDGKNTRFHGHFERRLREIGERHPGTVKGPFGVGGMVAFTPLGGEAERVRPFLRALFDAGVIGFAAGSDPVRARFLIPVGGMVESDIDAACEIIEDTLVKAAAGG